MCNLQNKIIDPDLLGKITIVIKKSSVNAVPDSETRQYTNIRSFQLQVNDLFLILLR
jgi:hypothetical protein